MNTQKLVQDMKWVVSGFFAGMTFAVAALWRVFPDWKMIVAAGVVLTAYCCVIAARKPKGLAGWEIKSGQYSVPARKLKTALNSAYGLHSGRIQAMFDGQRGSGKTAANEALARGIRTGVNKASAAAFLTTYSGGRLTGKQKCPQCKRLILVRKDGNLRVHKPCVGA